MLIPREIDNELYAQLKKANRTYHSTLFIHIWARSPIAFRIFTFEKVSHIFGIIYTNLHKYQSAKLVGHSFGFCLGTLRIYGNLGTALLNFKLLQTTNNIPEAVRAE